VRLMTIITILTLVSCAQAQTTQPYEPIFNGHDLSGWYTFLKGAGKDNDPDKVFQVHDGIVHIYKDAADGSAGPFGYLASNREFGDCRIRFEYKWGTKRFAPRAAPKHRDSGFLYFVFGPDGVHGGVWPKSVECQIQENDVGDVYAIETIVSSTVDPASASDKAPRFKSDSDGGVAYTTPGKGNDRIIRSEMLEKKPLPPLNEQPWNTIEVILQGDSAVHIVNGKVNMHIHGAKPATQPAGGNLTRGRILFQAEGAEVMYRNIEMKP